MPWGCHSALEATLNFCTQQSNGCMQRRKKQCQTDSLLPTITEQQIRYYADCTFTCYLKRYGNCSHKSEEIPTSHFGFQQQQRSLFSHRKQLSCWKGNFAQQHVLYCKTNIAGTSVVANISIYLWVDNPCIDTNITADFASVTAPIV